MTYRFVHFSDPQLVPAGMLNYDIDPQARLKHCVDTLLQQVPESSACIITGDLTHWGEKEAYKALKEELDRLSFPVYCLMGNHDHRQNFLDVFPNHPRQQEGFIQFTVETELVNLICLDTLDDRKRSGVLCEQRLAWLKHELEAANKPVCLFMHHPPFETGLASMDRDNLVNSEALRSMIQPHKEWIRHLFFGHLHRSVSGHWQGISFSCPPSLVHQTPFNFDNPKPDSVSPEPPVYNLVDIHPDRLVVHTHNFLHDSPTINSRACQRYQKPLDPEL
ncbi:MULTISPECIES: phosphodiesterase [unclassified Endozoicomonas]|uniref:phosphodiesterase n=1 Tax=unclassified Endozoicomonas TaxID=2644528 RepID=UPI0021484702|nr:MULTISPECIES: phosphodiesterase [unclassified Endozoicomonas]